jgi:hypothetical protein
MGKSWTELRAGELKGAEQRFWAALFGHAEEIVKRINTDPDFTEGLGGMVVRYHKKTLANKKARTEKEGKGVTYRVADCFANRNLFYQPDSDIVRWLPATLPNLPAGSPKCLVTKENEIFRQMAERELGASGKSDQELMKLLVEKQKCFSLKQIEEAVVNGYVGDDKSLKLHPDGKANFFFVEGESGAVFVVSVGRPDDRRGVHILRFACACGWGACRLVFFRN